jgi:hypothetical protein
MAPALTGAIVRLERRRRNIQRNDVARNEGEDPFFLSGSLERLRLRRRNMPLFSCFARLGVRSRLGSLPNPIDEKDLFT